MVLNPVRAEPSDTKPSLVHCTSELVQGLYNDRMLHNSTTTDSSANNTPSYSWPNQSSDVASQKDDLHKQISAKQTKYRWLARCRGSLTMSNVRSRLRWNDARWQWYRIYVRLCVRWNIILTHHRQTQLGMPSLQGQSISSSLETTGWRRLIGPVMLQRGSNYPLLWAVDDCIMCRGITSSCQSAVTSKVVKCCCSGVFSCKQCYSNYSDLYLYYTQNKTCSFKLLTLPAGKCKPIPSQRSVLDSSSNQTVITGLDSIRESSTM